MTVVGVHGIAQEQLGPKQLKSRWADALVDGLEIAAGASPSPPTLKFDVAYYGDLFLSEADQGVRVTKGPKGSWEWEDAGHLFADEVAFLEEATAEIPVSDSSPTKGFAEVPEALVPMVRRLCREFDGWSVLALLSELVQVRRYLADKELAEQIRARVIAQIGGSCRVLIGHSLGSVVAFETLALHPDLHVDTLITAGSPLSMRTVVNRLRAGTPRSGVGLPGSVRRWVNVYDKSDPVAGAGVICRLWADAEDFEVNNGNEPHSITRYLSKRATGKAVLEGLNRQ